ncbi:hypothetical protein EYF80_025385 [Liparis tanakae]|uniref:Uncharacterized protein n=1 Tax=Liparis tanakae TaxID=230148 RepID=A0A4Z2HGQ6_9TELE|nr:hypothetical protein EYF80_025385 [Liparis tanakae]
MRLEVSILIILRPNHKPPLCRDNFSVMNSDVWGTKARSKGCHKGRKADCGAQPENQWSVNDSSLRHNRWPLEPGTLLTWTGTHRQHT